MLLGRNKELKSLSTYYDRENSQILVLYGEKDMGKTALCKEFMSDKPGFYYQACQASEREQKYKMGQWLAHMGIKTLKFPEFFEVFAAFNKEHSQKKVIVFDEFQNIIKTCPTFMDELISFIHDSWNNQEYLVILVSSSVSFVENSLISKIGDSAFELSGFVKLKSLSFDDLKDYFPHYSNDECAMVWAILGGVPGLWTHFDEKASLKDNIVKKIIQKNGSLRDYVENRINFELREPMIYSTILSALSEGKNKLLEICEHTDFIRSKVSVYLKNLMELEYVRKIYNVETENNEYAQKGIYAIKNHLMDFYFSFMYKYSSEAENLSCEEFYKTVVYPGLRSFSAKYFNEICAEFLSKLNDKDKLPVKCNDFGTWVGKPGTIDVVGTSEQGETVLGLCSYDKPMFSYEDYEWLIYCARKARLPYENVFLFTSGRFDEKLTLECKIKNSLKLVYLENM